MSIDLSKFNLGMRALVDILLTAMAQKVNAQMLAGQLWRIEGARSYICAAAAKPDFGPGQLIEQIKADPKAYARVKPYERQLTAYLDGFCIEVKRLAGAATT